MTPARRLRVRCRGLGHGMRSQAHPRTPHCRYPCQRGLQLSDQRNLLLSSRLAIRRRPRVCVWHNVVGPGLLYVSVRKRGTALLPCLARDPFHPASPPCRGCLQRGLGLHRRDDALALAQPVVHGQRHALPSAYWLRHEDCEQDELCHAERHSDGERVAQRVGDDDGDAACKRVSNNECDVHEVNDVYRDTL